MFVNLTAVQELSTEQFLRIQELKRELAEKNELVNKLLAIAFLTNPEVAKQVTADQNGVAADRDGPASKAYPRLPARKVG